MRKKRKWYKHKSRGLDTKYGGPCVTLEVNWWEGTLTKDVRLREMVKA